MLKKWVIVISVLLLVSIFIYQKNYLSQLKIESLRSSKQTEPSKTVVGDGVQFNILFYDKNGFLSSEMAGERITYYEDATFKAQGDLIYKIFDNSQNVINTIKTNLALGYFEQGPELFFLLSGSRQLKSLELPEEVFFNFNGNQGQTKNVFIDAINRTISSKEHIQSQGPDGIFSADGFLYDIDTKNFTFNSKVRGLYKKGK